MPRFFARWGRRLPALAGLITLWLGPLAAPAQQAPAVTYRDRRIASPLIFIDAVPCDSAALRQLKPADIDNVVVVKAPQAHRLAPQFPDADARGLLLITTKANASSPAVQRLGRQLSRALASPAASPPATTVCLDCPAKGPKPVFYVDGVRLDSAALRRLNPGDVASVEVLKGAQAAQVAQALGPGEARRGVVVITTKAGEHGRAGRRFRRRLRRLGQ